MTIIVSLPDKILSGEDKDLDRHILEQLALEGFKSGQISTAQVRRIPGFESRFQVYGSATRHGGLNLDKRPYYRMRAYPISTRESGRQFSWPRN